MDFWLTIASLGMMAVLWAVYSLRTTPLWQSSKSLSFCSVTVLSALLLDLCDWHVYANYLYACSAFLHVLFFREMVDNSQSRHVHILRMVPFFVCLVATFPRTAQLDADPTLWNISPVGLVMYGYLCFGWYSALRFRKDIRLSETVFLLLDYTLVTLCMCIQSIHPEPRFIGFLHSFCLLGLFLFIHDPEKLIDGRTRLPNRQAFTYKAKSIVRKRKERTLVIATIADYLEMESLLPTEIVAGILRHVGHVMQRCDRYGNVYRVNRNQFAISLHSSDPDSIREVSQLALSAFKDSPLKEKSNLKISGMVSTIRYPDDFTTIDECYLALRQLAFRANIGINESTSISTFRTGALKRRLLVAHLVRHVENAQASFKIFPAYDVKQGRIHSGKAFLTLSDNLVEGSSPVEYIPVAQSEGAVGQFAEFTLRESCLLVKSGILEKYHYDNISIVLDSRLWMSYHLIPHYLELADLFGISPSSIAFVMQASLFHQGLGMVNDNLKDMRENGIHLALTNYGKGFTNVLEAHEMPDSTAAFSSAFTAPTAKTYGGRKVIAASLDALHMLQYKTLVEGIVHKEDAAYYMTLGVDYLSGPLYGKPIHIVKRKGVWNV